MYSSPGQTKKYQAIANIRFLGDTRTSEFKTAPVYGGCQNFRVKKKVPATIIMIRTIQPYIKFNFNNIKINSVLIINTRNYIPMLQMKKYLMQYSDSSIFCALLTNFQIYTVFLHYKMSSF